MTPEERQLLYTLADMLNRLEKSDRYMLEKLIQISDGRNIQLGKSTGTKIGTETTQKLAFFNATPVVQYATSFNSAPSGSYGSTEQNILNGLRLALISYGLIHT